MPGIPSLALSETILRHVGSTAKIACALSRKETKVAIIIKTNTLLGTLGNFLDAYLTGGGVNN